MGLAVGVTSIMLEEDTVIIEVRTKFASWVLGVEQVGSLCEFGDSCIVQVVVNEPAIVGELVVRKHGKSMEVGLLVVPSGGVDASIDLTVVGWVIDGEDELS